ncbi:TrkH family potassium uptake protein [soil metagenome]
MRLRRRNVGAATSPARFARASRRLPSTAAHMVGLTLTFTAAGMAISLLVDLGTGGRGATALGVSSLLTGVVGLLLWRTTRVPARVSARETFTAVTMTWLVVSLAGALPFVLSGVLPDLDDALFESISGFTTTGSTVLSPIEGTARGILFWRQFTQWFGGMGMIVLAVAVLPFLGVGGLELIRAEAPGPTSDRLAPRVSETAKRLWLIYGGLTVLGVVALLFSGMSAYDAVAHSFSAVATGGFSPYDASIAHFDSLAVEVVLIAGMFAAAVNFTLHWRAVQGEPTIYWRDPGFRFYAGVVLFGIAVITLLNVADGMAVGRALRDTSFGVVSLISTTGFATADFVQWVPAAQLLLLGLMVTGGMPGSTCGGVKLLRVQVMVRHAWRELRQAGSPRAVLPVKLGNQAVPEAIVARIAGFVLVYFAIAVIGILALAALGADLPTSTGSVITALGSGGPGLGETGPVSNFTVLDRPSRVVLSALMLLGRLEIFPVLLMFAGLARVGPRRRRHRRAASQADSERRPIRIGADGGGTR